VAMKLPMDLTTPIRGVVDQQAKLGSVVFMCLMMNFLLPSLATMNGKELVTNIIALGLLVIQIHTGLVSYSEDKHLSDYYGFQKSTDPFAYANRAISITYDLKSKYQAAHKRALIVQQQAEELTVENLKQRVLPLLTLSQRQLSELARHNRNIPVVDIETPNIRQYVLQPQDDMELPDALLYFIIKSVERSIQNAEKQQPSKLMKLLENFRDFEGVKKFDILLVQSLPGLDYPNCWSLPVVTLATIALSLCKIQPSTLKNILTGDEG
ncbi:hypothetical protein Tco_1242067, partial [Tanacetum coccineum]